MLKSKINSEGAATEVTSSVGALDITQPPRAELPAVFLMFPYHFVHHSYYSALPSLQYKKVSISLTSL